MVCPPLSNGLVQLVCEDGGIVSLLILPQLRPFMRARPPRLRQTSLMQSSPPPPPSPPPLLPPRCRRRYLQTVNLVWWCRVAQPPAVMSLSGGGAPSGKRSISRSIFSSLAVDHASHSLEVDRRSREREKERDFGVPKTDKERRRRSANAERDGAEKMTMGTSERSFGRSRGAYEKKSSATRRFTCRDAEPPVIPRPRLLVCAPPVSVTRGRYARTGGRTRCARARAHATRRDATTRGDPLRYCAAVCAALLLPQLFRSGCRWNDGI